MNLRFLISVLIILPFLACEKEIDIEIVDAEQRIVIEGVFKEGAGNNYLLLSKTGGIYENTNFEKISGAEISVTDKDGNTYVLVEDLVNAGRYSSNTLDILPSNNYTLNAIIEGEEIMAICKTFSKPIIDSLTYLSHDLGLGGSETQYLITYHSTDPAGEKNSYRVRISINGVESEIYYLGNDDFIDGQKFEGPFLGTRAISGDTVFVEVISMSEEVYRYFYQLANNIDQSPFSATPANPEGNIEGNAIGYFGVFTTDTMTLYLP